jgi:hypothetical protein
LKARGLELVNLLRACGGLLLAACGQNSDGSPSGDAAGGGPSASGDGPTWHADIAPLVTAKCLGCHVPGGIAPLSLATYADSKPWASLMAAQVASGAMPPFLARTSADCQPRFGFKDDLRLSAREIALFDAWRLAGAPEGDPKTAAALPAAAELELSDAEVSVTIPSPVTIEGNADRFVCFSLAPDLSPLAATGPEAALLGDRVLIDAVQIKAGNAAIVHHVLLYTDEAGESIALAGDKGYYDCFGGPKLGSTGLVMAWAPGGVPVRAPEKVTMAVPSKGRLVMQVHYHPTGSVQTDSSTSVQLRGYHAGIPEYVAQLALIGNFKAQNAQGMGLQPGPDDRATGPEFRIPAGVTRHTETMLFSIPKGAPEYHLWSVGTHMHYVGTDMRIDLTRAVPGAQPAEECLLDTPHWDFNWQRGYLYDTPIEEVPTFEQGDVLKLGCTYDNSMANPAVSSALVQQGLSAPRDVVLGEETLDEMCLGVFGIAQKVSDLIK